MKREEWYRWCEEISDEELLKERTGGLGSILKTLFHISDVEWSWIRVLESKSDFQAGFENYKSLDKLRQLDAKFRPEVEGFLANWDDSMEHRLLTSTEKDGTVVSDQWGEVMRHVV